jgi:TolB protein
MALALAVAVTATGVAQVPLGPPGQALVTTSIRTNDTEVFIVDPVTGDAFNLTKAPASEERYPSWSPDGRQVVFTSDRGDGRTYDLYLLDADGTNLRQLTHLAAGSVAYWPSWTADGRWVYFNEGTASVIGRVHPDGTSVEIVTSGRDGHISPDGTRIVYTERGGRGWGVFTMDTTGRNRRQIVPNESEIGGVAPVWSSDGRRIAYSGQVDQVAEIFTCDADGSRNEQLTHLGKISSSPAFSPDGRYLTFRVTDFAYWRDEGSKHAAYSEKAADKRPVYIMKADGGEVRVIDVLHYQSAIDGSRAEWRPPVATGQPPGR